MNIGRNSALSDINKQNKRKKRKHPFIKIYEENVDKENRVPGYENVVEEEKSVQSNLACQGRQTKSVLKMQNDLPYSNMNSNASQIMITPTFDSKQQSLALNA